MCLVEMKVRSGGRFYHQLLLMNDADRLFYQWMNSSNREANTLGSKSVSVQTTQVSMELKVLIEQMREQIQNIE